MAHYVLIKKSGSDINGANLSAWRCAERLLAAGLWPLWQHSRNRKAIVAGDKVAIYLAGTSEVMGRASVARKESWSISHRKAYPLVLEGTPESVLILHAVETFECPIAVADRRSRLSFIRPGLTKWGVAFMGGTRAVSETDFRVLTQH